MNSILKYAMIALMFCIPQVFLAQDALEIIKKSDEKIRGIKSSYSEIKMTILRPDWSREIEMKGWSKGTEYSLIVVTAPSREKGTAFLKRENEIWNWQPTIDRVIKLPPSMMMQSWMGSDFKNDDLVRESSIVVDYTHKLLGSEIIEGMDCYKIELIPKEDAPVVWGRIISWIDKEEYIQLKTEFFDEDDYLVNTMIGKDIEEMGGKIIATTMEIIPEEEPENKTILHYNELQFDIPVEDRMFSVNYMKRIK
jgi:outer membrane lipoprotein-sorting protein